MVARNRCTFVHWILFLVSTFACIAVSGWHNVAHCILLWENIFIPNYCDMVAGYYFPQLSLKWH